MPTATLVSETHVSEDLLDPISDDQPTGLSLRWTPEWDRIKEARRSDDALDAGKWAKKEQKVANWHMVRDLATAMLRTRSKDLQIALWLTEANAKLEGFPGVRDGFRLTRELMVRYWDRGLYPAMEDGPEDRAAPFEWLNDKLIDSLIAIPITRRSDSGQDYSLIDLKDARRVGSEAACKDSDGDIDAQKKREFDKALAAGRPSMDMFERAAAETSSDVYKDIHSGFEQAQTEFRELEKVVDEKFGDFAPSLSAVRSALAEINQEFTNILSKRRQEEPAAIAPDSPGEIKTTRTIAGVPAFTFNPIEEAAVNGASWQKAEALVRSGKVDVGLGEMTRLAASETTGRNRFQRKLLLAEVCLASNRQRLARVVLEELAEQIDKFQLEGWESTDLIAAVWTRLYRLYSQGESPDSDAANKLYERLCRLDPWQALACNE